MSTVERIIEAANTKPAEPEKAKPKHEWVHFRTLEVDVPGLSGAPPWTVRLRVSASTHHVRRWSTQFVNQNGFPQSITVHVEIDEKGELQIRETLDASKALLDEAQKIIAEEARKDAEKEKAFRAKRSRPTPSVTPKPPTGAPAPGFIRAMGKTAKKRAKEAARKGGAS
jgi:hypothetical protein